MSTFSEVRDVTGWIRPGGKHGCAIAQVFPGIWTAHYHDVDTTEKLNRAAYVESFTHICIQVAVLPP